MGTLIYTLCTLTALACAVANYLGNHGVVWAAVAILVGLVVYVLVVLKVRLPRA